MQSYSIVQDSNLINNNFNELQNKANVKTIKTGINLFYNQADGFIKEKYYFELKKGVHNKLVRKISLGGTSDNVKYLRVTSL